MTQTVDFETGELYENGRGTISIIEPTVEAYEITPVGLEIRRPLTYDEWIDCGSKLFGIVSAARWAIGDWLIYGEGRGDWGKKYAQALDQTRISYTSLANCARASQGFAIFRRRKNLSWSHHLEAVSLKTEAEQDVALDLATAKGWSSDDVRAYVKSRKILTANVSNVPNGIYNVIYADPPWEYDNNIKQGGPASLHYPTMPLENICAFLKSIDLKIADDAVLFMWVTNPFLQDAFKIVEAWGFAYKTNLVWVKTDLVKPGSGFYVRGRHELLFICTRGSFTPLDDHIAPPIGSVIEAPLREHSQKPEEAYRIIERLYPQCQYIELFARQRRAGWESYGDELS